MSFTKSCPSNIAEGHGRFGGNELRKFLSIASGSLAELATQIYLSHELDYLAGERKERLLADIDEMANQVIAVLRHPEAYQRLCPRCHAAQDPCRRPGARNLPLDNGTA